MFTAVLAVAGDDVVIPAKPTSLKAEEIIRRSVAANERDWSAAPQYSYIENTRDASGSKTSRVTMLFGSPYNRVLSINGRVLSPDEQRREQQKFEKAAAHRRSESKAATAARVAGYQKERRQDHLMMEQLTAAFNFTLTGETNLSGHDVYLLRAVPRPGYQPPNMESRVLTGMKGELWIDKATFQWVQVHAEVIAPVTIGGFLATVEPGTYFQLEKMPVEGDIWLPKRFSVESQSKVLMMFHHGTQEEDVYSGYEKAPDNDAHSRR
jgi:hypothetical protein